MRFPPAPFRFCVLLALLTALSACGTTAMPGPAPAGYYRVKPGDTLFRIAQNHGQTVGSLASWNQLKDSHSIEAGQLLRVVPPAGNSSSSARPPSPPAKRAASRPAPAAPSAPAAGRLALIWPVKGEVVGHFNGSSRKGIDIAGRKGEPVAAAAAGKVVYAGAGIDAYGRLLIIKHNNDFLTAYAHNQSLLVKEGAQVKQGQKIATLGRSGTNRFKLQFQVRYKGKAVDPVAYLP